MPRMYVAQTNGVATTVATDIFELVAAATHIIVVHGIEISQTSDTGDAQEELLSILLKRGVGNTSGSGGSSPTKSKLQTGAATSAATLEANNTTVAVAGGGSLTTLHASAWNVRMPWLWIPTPEMRIVLAPSETLIVGAPAPADSLTVNATIYWEEIG